MPRPAVPLGAPLSPYTGASGPAGSGKLPKPLPTSGLPWAHRDTPRSRSEGPQRREGRDGAAWPPWRAIGPRGGANGPHFRTWAPRGVGPGPWQAGASPGGLERCIEKGGGRAILRGLSGVPFPGEKDGTRTPHRYLHSTNRHLSSNRNSPLTSEKKAGI